MTASSGYESVPQSLKDEARERERAQALDQRRVARQQRNALNTAYQEHLLWVAKWEAAARIILAFALVFLTIAAAVIAVLQSGDPTGQKVSQLLTPLAALAGIAVGYFFGQAPHLAGGLNRDASDAEETDDSEK